MPATHGSARQEAERLVVTMLAMASQGRSRATGWGMLGDAVTGLVGQATGRAHSGTDAGPPAGARRAEGWATGTPECCVCPVCRAIAGLRDPDPQTVERLATGAGDFAAGVASLLRAFATVTGEHPTGDHPDATAPSTPAPAPATTAGSRDAGAAPGPATARTADEPTAGPGGVAGPALAARIAEVWAAATAGGTTASTDGPVGRRTADDPWASATAAGHDPTARVPRPARSATVPDAPVVTAAGGRPRDPWAAATGAPAEPAGGPVTETAAGPATGPADGAPAATAGAVPAVPVDDRVADPGDDAPSAAAV